MRVIVERTYGEWNADWQKTNFYKTTNPSTHEVIELSGEAVGCQWVRRHPDELELVRLYLLPSAQGRGIGTFALKRLLADAEESGLPVRLRVMRGSPAERLYTRLGFVVVGTTQTHLQMERVQAASRE